MAMFGGGGRTPAYAGGGQPPPGMTGGLFGGMFGGAVPPYMSTSASAPSAPTQSGTHEISQMSCPIDPEALAAGQIAIVIPRSGP
ncbi:MAG: hypothetical protein WKG01_05885 [Kofleriaceae bacterium]